MGVLNWLWAREICGFLKGDWVKNSEQTTRNFVQMNNEPPTALTSDRVCIESWGVVWGLAFWNEGHIGEQVNKEIEEPPKDQIALVFEWKSRWGLYLGNRRRTIDIESKSVTVGFYSVVEWLEVLFRLSFSFVHNLALQRISIALWPALPVESRQVRGCQSLGSYPVWSKSPSSPPPDNQTMSCDMWQLVVCGGKHLSLHVYYT
jgi:hypothetical protein